MAKHTVTSLATTDAPGTLRWALTQPAPREVHFGVSGVIPYDDLRITIPDGTTLDGSTAPSPGVCVRGGVDVASDCLVRHMRFRPGAIGNSDALQLVGADTVVEYCSMSWGNDENIGVKRREELEDERNLTVRWCILAECEKAMLAWSANNFVFHHNLLAHNYIRNPVFTGVRGDFYNNVVYDIGNMSMGMKGTIEANIVGNYFVVGNASRLFKYCVTVENMGDGEPSPETKIYLDGNSGPRTRDGAPEWDEVRYDNGGLADEAIHRVATPYAWIAEPDGLTVAATAYAEVMASAGASLPVRDATDTRIVDEVANKLRPGTYPRNEVQTRPYAEAQWVALSIEYGEEEIDPDIDVETGARLTAVATTSDNGGVATEFEYTWTRIDAAGVLWIAGTGETITAEKPGTYSVTVVAHGTDGLQSEPLQSASSVVVVQAPLAPVLESVEISVEE